MTHKQKKTPSTKVFYDTIVVILIYLFALWAGEGDIKFAFIIGLLTIIAIKVSEK